MNNIINHKPEFKNIMLCYYGRVEFMIDIIRIINSAIKQGAFIRSIIRRFGKTLISDSIKPIKAFEVTLIC